MLRPTYPRTDVLALAFVLSVLLVSYAGDKLALELVGRATGLVDEPAEVAGHLGELTRAEDHQNQQPDDDQLFPADTEHNANITRELTGYNAEVRLADGSTGGRT